MEKPKLIIDGKRCDGRAFDELRPFKIQAGILNKADGSAYIEWGNNKIMAAVYGPRECIPRHDASPYRAIIHCRYLMASFSTLDEHGRSGPNRRSIEVSKVIKEVFENVVMTENFPKTAIDIFIEVLQADGGTRCAGITAAAVALADAGIPMRDLPCAIAAGKIENEVALDFGKLEDNYGDGDMPIAIAPRNNEILLLQMDGMFTKDELKRAIELAFGAFPKINALQAEALRIHYAVKRDEISV